jgi:hypothetical protein
MGRYVASLTANMKCSTIDCTAGTFIFKVTGLTNPFNIYYPKGGIISVATQ